MPPLCRTKHNRAKPMSELSSAMFLIADGNEFRFARFYIVCEAIRLEALESPLIVCACRTFPRWIVKTWKRHGIRCKYPSGRNALIFSQRIFHLHFQLKSVRCTSRILLIAKRTLPADCNNSPLMLAAGGTDRLNRHSTASYHFDSLEF